MPAECHEKKRPDVWTFSRIKSLIFGQEWRRLAPPAQNRLFIEKGEVMKYSIAEQIKFYMDIKGMTQQEVAKKIGVSQNTISRWINNVCEPRASYIFIGYIV